MLLSQQTLGVSGGSWNARADQRRGGSEREREMPCDGWEGEQKGSVKSPRRWAGFEE